MIRARLINAWRRAFPHPAAIARREEARRGREARARADAEHWRRALEGCAVLNAQIARSRSGE